MNVTVSSSPPDESPRHDDGTESDSDRDRETGRVTEKPDPETLRELYEGRGLSSYEIADELEADLDHRPDPKTVRNWLKAAGVDLRAPGGKREPHVPIVAEKVDPVRGGYQRWIDSLSDESVYVHQLLAISAGADPNKLFTGQQTITFENGRRDHLVPDNISVVDRPWRDAERLMAALEEHPDRRSLADAWGCDPQTISEWMDRHEIERHWNADEGRWVVTRNRPADENED